MAFSLIWCENAQAWGLFMAYLKKLDFQIPRAKQVGKLDARQNNEQFDHSGLRQDVFTSCVAHIPERCPGRAMALLSICNQVDMQVGMALSEISQQLCGAPLLSRQPWESRQVLVQSHAVPSRSRATH
jgi:hypothetical protein